MQPRMLSPRLLSMSKELRCDIRPLNALHASENCALITGALFEPPEMSLSGLFGSVIDHLFGLLN
jgi:hypothetical protein